MKLRKKLKAQNSLNQGKGKRGGKTKTKKKGKKINKGVFVTDLKKKKEEN